MVLAASSVFISMKAWWKQGCEPGQTPREAQYYTPKAGVGRALPGMGSHTWFFPFSIRRLVTFPKGSPREMTSPSVTSLGSFRMWITLEGTPVLLLSPLNFLLSFPFAEKRGGLSDTEHPPRLPHSNTPQN